MQVSKISFKSSNVNNSYQKNQNYNSRFLYTSAKNIPENKIKNMKVAFGIVGAIAATTIAGIRLLKGGKSYVAKSVVELADANKGFNKIKVYAQNINEIKERFLYPYKATMLGDNYFVKKNKLKEGMILATVNSHDANMMKDAFQEHAEALGFNYVKFPETERTGRKIQKWMLKEFENAKEYFKKTEKYTVIDIGNVDGLIKPKNLKTESEILEQKEKSIKMLKYLHDKKPNGVLWTAWSEDTKSWPFFYDSPILITKLVD